LIGVLLLGFLAGVVVGGVLFLVLLGFLEDG